MRKHMKTPQNLSKKILGPYRISHHPLCNNFSDHTYNINGRKVCRGCFMQYSGMILSLFIILLGSLPSLQLWNRLNEIEVGLIIYLMILPTFITAFIIKNRKMKDFARFMLGASFTIAIIQFVFTPSVFIKIWIALNFIPGYLYLNRRRAKKNEEICHLCPEYGNIPYCSGYQIYVDREQIFVSQLIHGGIKDPFSLPPEQMDD